MSYWDRFQPDDPALLRGLRAEVERLSPLAIPPWTTDKPTTPGWYWWSSKPSLRHNDHMIDEVDEHHDGELWLMNDGGSCMPVADTPDDWLWSGPIPRPPGNIVAGQQETP